jgi:predicted metal-dependent phosphoesterase TrpH
MKFDLHIHTTRHSPDSVLDPFEMLEQAREIGLDGVVITEHDWLWTADELDELRTAAPDLVVLAGIEVSTRQGHFLVYGVKNPFKTPAGIDVADLCREMHRQGGAVVAAHPFRWGQRFHDILKNNRPELDGLEMMSSNMDPDCRRRTLEVQHRLGVAGLGNSDAHDVNTLGFCYTEFDAAVRDVRDLVEAIRGRKTSPHERRELARA